MQGVEFFQGKGFGFFFHKAKIFQFFSQALKNPQHGSKFFVPKTPLKKGLPPSRGPQG